MPKHTDKKLSTIEKYKMVIDEYFINGFNESKAWLKHYPNGKVTSAVNSFQKMLKRAEISTYLKQKKEDAQKAAKIDQERLLKILSSWLEADITQYIDLTKNEVQQLPLEVRQLVTKFSPKTVWHDVVNEKGKKEKTRKIVYKLEFVSKEKAAEMIARHIGFNEADNNQSRPKVNNVINLGKGQKPNG